MPIWTPEELKILKVNYPVVTIEKLCSLLGRRWGAIESMARKFNLKHPGFQADNSNRWSKDEIEILRKNWPAGNIDETYKLFPNRTSTAIRLKAKKLKIKRIEHAGRIVDFSPLLEDNPIAFYWVGFLLGDGVIDFKRNTLQLRISAKDEEHIQKYAYLIKANLRFWEGYYTAPFSDKIIYGKFAIVAGTDKNRVPLIAKKFDWKKRKTYNPPDFSKWKFHDDLLLSLIIGFIDADGTITHSGAKNKKGKQIRIRCHESWLDFMKYADNEVHRILNVKKDRDYWKLISAKADRCAVAKVAWHKHIIICRLKEKAVKLKLPVLNRKWDQIDPSKIGKKWLHN